ncbi:MAG: TetR family transcriptional regulator [Sphingomonadales bacterium CG12_big_fil_rev_8_21_14_0_65_65_10]|uniref:TetR family transcriptional regulator n=1 Tax=Blastomonas marina TaxID=1867408 RepID=A0ABQ1FHM5_9SPHN|nr:TetR/AcrR family transcriptional regulator [Blastomonas marina]PIW54218.1 MAG: TetR family transcriptional regulator [Sphingomonadales bacterium CG12_big_fil_rev_8_21_14_0_65_65_10]WPZ03346.1 TetR/AcrR family transcriptional regulator [Blastomonas marina]GGA11296.1 TetR family transcriptional regulator [Blastomonas marina]
MADAAAEKSADKTPRTARGRKTQRALLDAAEAEFGERGFHESSIVSITKRAGVALGTFYTYFDSKDALFRALVRDMSGRVKDAVAPAIAGIEDPVGREGAALEAFLGFARDHKEIYRIIDEAEFVAPDSWREHYERTAARILERLQEAAAEGAISGPIDEVHAWALMGMNVFLGLKFGVMDEDRPVGEVARIANALIAKGLAR